MPNYRRFRVPGGTYFITVNLLNRRSDLLVTHIDALRDAVRGVRRDRPFHIDAWVVLPEHIHCVITLPLGEYDYANRIKSMKMRFNASVPAVEKRSPVRAKRGERGIWQRRFWEHVIRDDEDYARHLNYVHYNPVKHGLVRRVREWPYSTFHHSVAAGLYPLNWGEEGVEDMEAGETKDACLR